MASIHTRKSTKYFIACFRDSAGRQHTRSTRIEAFPVHEDPKERARLAGEARRKAKGVADSFERASRGELKRETAIRETLLSLVELAGGPRLKVKTADEFLTAWVEDAETAGKTETTLKRYRQVKREFLAHLGDKADAPAEHITPEDVQGYVIALRAKGLAPKSLQNTLKILRIPFTLGHRLGSLTTNPAAAVKVESSLGVERGTFTKNEIRALLTACDGFENGEQWRTAVHLGYYAALRIGDATGLSWGAVDFQCRALVFTPEKTRRMGRKVIIPFAPALERHLLSLTASDNPEEPLTPDLKTPAGERPKLSKAFARLLRRAGVDNPQERSHAVKTGGRAVSKKSFHALRHSLASDLANAGIPPEIRMAVTGHSDLRTHGKYSHLDPETIRAALAKLA